MSREKTCRANLFRCLVKGLALLNELSDALQEHERRVAFIGVKNAGLNPKSPKDAQATDTKHNLLPNSMFFVSAVEPCRQLAIAVLVFFDIGVHEIERHRAEIHTPHDDKNAQASDLQLDEEPVVMLRTGRFDWRFTPFEQFVDVFLPTVGLDPLMKVTLRIYKPNAQ